MSDVATPFNVQTPNLSLNKPLVGGDDDIWGDLLNANADTLDSAISGLQHQAAGPAKVVVSATAPAANPGALWFDSVSGQLFVSFDDGNSVQWVIATAATVPTGALTGTSPIGSDKLSPLWWDSTSGQLFVQYDDGTSIQWVSANSVTVDQMEGLFLPLSGGTVTGMTTFMTNVGVAGEIIPARLNLGASNGNGLGITLSPTQGLDHTGTPIWLNYYFNGTNSNVGNQNFNLMIVNDDVAYTGNGQSNALQIQQYIRAHATRAGGLWVEAAQIEAPINPFGFSTALTAASSLSFNCGGTALTFGHTAGAATTLNTYTSAGPGATFIDGIVGYEMDIHAAAGSSLGGKTGLLIVLLSDDGASGAFGSDSAIAFGGSGPAYGWDHMLYFGGASGQIPYKTTATLITAGEPQTPSTGQARAAWGIDLSSVLFSSGFARSLGFLVDGSGNTTGQRFNMSNWSFTPSATGLTIDATSQRSSLTSIANGGGGWTVGDKAMTAYGGVYQVTAVSGGVATTVVQLVPGVATSPPANPVATTATNSSIYHPNPSGLTLNLAWTAANTFTVNPPMQPLGGISFGANVGSSNIDTNKHIILNQFGYGIGVTPNRINYSVPSGAIHALMVSGTDIVEVSYGLVNVGGGLQVSGWAGPAAPFQGGGIGWNHTNGGAEVDFFNAFVGAPASFVWYQTTGTGTFTQLAYMNPAGGFGTTGGLGVFGTAAVATKPTVTGAKAGNAALASLMTALAAYGLVTDSTS